MSEDLQEEERRIAESSDSRFSAKPSSEGCEDTTNAKMAEEEERIPLPDSSESQTSCSTMDKEELRGELDELKKDLEVWKYTFVHLRSLLTWQQSYHPAVIFGLTTLVFAVIWLVEPSVMTTFGVLGLLINGLDFSMPLVSPFLFSNVEWTAEGEENFEDACERILYVRKYLKSFVQGLSILKQERPKMYFAVVMGTLAVLAWIGHLMNNLYLTYCIVLISLMVPGLRRTGLMKEFFQKYWQAFKQFVFGRLNIKKKSE